MEYFISVEIREVNYGKLSLGKFTFIYSTIFTERKFQRNIPKLYLYFIWLCVNQVNSWNNNTSIVKATSVGIDIVRF